MRLQAELDDAAAWIAAGRDTEEAAARLHLAGAGTGFADTDPAEELAARLRLASGWEAWAIARGRETADQLGVLRRALGR